MPTDIIYVLRPSTEEDRPYIDFEMEENWKGIPWLDIGYILDGTRPAAEYQPVRLIVLHPEAEQWDFYPCSGTTGLISERAASVLGPYTTQCFDLLDAQINDARFFFLRIKGHLDCLDREHSVVVPFPSDPQRIMEIEEYRFRKEAIPDPILFVIPEGPSDLFGSHTIGRLVREARLRGFEIIEADADD